MWRLVYCTLILLVLGECRGWVAQRPPYHQREPQHCSIQLVESIPENLTYDEGSVNHTSTYEAWKTLLNLAARDINIASFYWTLTGSEVVNETVPSSHEGEVILEALAKKASEVYVRIATDGGPRKIDDLEFLAKQRFTDIRWVNFPRLGMTGVLHTKLWIVDGKHAYLGSANMDFRSLTQVKELGLLFLNCENIVSDLEAIFNVYWYIGQEDVPLPSKWPDFLAARSNVTHPMIYNEDSEIFFASSPPALSTPSRSQDIDALLHVIQNAEKFIYLSVMDYAPLIIFYKHEHKNMYWPDIDNALREAAVIRRVRVRLLISRWNHTSVDLVGYLASLQGLSKIPGVNLETRLFEVPAFTPEQTQIPFGRVNHNKYMVTDKSAYIGTSNWSGDYFTNTGGISATITPRSTHRNRKSIELPDLRMQTEELFLRDWSSSYAHPLPN